MKIAVQAEEDTPVLKKTLNFANDFKVATNPKRQAHETKEISNVHVPAAQKETARI